MRTFLFLLLFPAFNVSAQPFLPEEPFLCLKNKVKSIKINKGEVYTYRYENHLIITKFIIKPSPAECFHYHYYSDINEPDSIIYIEKWPDTTYTTSTKIHYNYGLTGHLIKIEKFDNADPANHYMDSLIYSPQGQIGSVFYFRNKQQRVQILRDTSTLNSMQGRDKNGNYLIPPADIKLYKIIRIPDMELYHQVTYDYDENKRVIKEKYGQGYKEFIYSKNGFVSETNEFHGNNYSGKDKYFTKTKYTYNKKGLIKKKQIRRFHIRTTDGSQVVDDQVEFQYRYTFY